MARRSLMFRTRPRLPDKGITRTCSYYPSDRLHAHYLGMPLDSQGAILSVTSPTSEPETGSDDEGIMLRAMFTPTLFGIILLSSILAAMPAAEAVNMPVGGIVQAPCGSDLPCLTLTGPEFHLWRDKRD